MSEFELDSDKYPTEETLEAITSWDDDHHELLKLVSAVYPDYGRFTYNPNTKIWHVSTGGWSGCEDIIGALQDNTMFWLMRWKMSKRGGYFEFETKPRLPV